MKELTEPKTIECPSRWTLFGSQTLEQGKTEIQKLAGIIVKGTEALGGVYMRLVDTIRHHGFTDDEVRKMLSRHFSEPRVSEILRVAKAPEEVYNRYMAGFFGFKAALRECRSYTITPGTELIRRKAKRAAIRLITLGVTGEIHVKGRVVTVH